jgi:HEAT repeat protein
VSDPRGPATVLELARTHPQIDVRREAIETLGDAEPTDALVRMLKGFATEENDAAVQQEAIDTLASLDHPNVLATLTELARTHPRASVRREAVEALADRTSDENNDSTGSSERSTILDLLTTLAKEDRDVEIQIEATETLGEIAGADAVTRLRELAEKHPDERIRAEAVESLGDHGASDGTAKILQAIALADTAERVRDEAIETLGELPDGSGIDALVEIARQHPDTKVQRRALEALLDIDHPRARAAFKLQKPSGR